MRERWTMEREGAIGGRILPRSAAYPPTRGCTTAREAKGGHQMESGSWASTRGASCGTRYPPTSRRLARLARPQEAAAAATARLSSASRHRLPAATITKMPAATMTTTREEEGTGGGKQAAVRTHGWTANHVHCAALKCSLGGEGEAPPSFPLLTTAFSNHPSLCSHCCDPTRLRRLHPRLPLVASP